MIRRCDACVVVFRRKTKGRRRRRSYTDHLPFDKQLSPALYSRGAGDFSASDTHTAPTRHYLVMLTDGAGASFDNAAAAGTAAADVSLWVL